MDKEKHIWAICQAVEKLSGIEVTWKNPSGASALVDDPCVCAHCNSFCMLVKSKYARECRIEENRNIMSQALKTRKPFRFTCHAGVCQYVVPILASARFEGVLLLGPFRRKRRNVKILLPGEEYDRLPVWDEKVISSCEVLLKHAASQYVSTITMSGHDEREIEDLRIARVCSHIANHLGDKVRAEELAELANLSVSRFLHRFSESTGVSLSKYIENLRMERAKDLLLHTDLNISDIAYELGACHQNYFSQVFAKKTGLPPKAFRNKYKARKGV